MCMTGVSMAVSAVCCSQCTARSMLIREQNNAADTQPRARYCSRHGNRHVNTRYCSRHQRNMLRAGKFCDIIVCGMLLHQQHTAVETRANTLLHTHSCKHTAADTLLQTHCCTHAAANTLLQTQEQYVARGDVYVCTYMLLAGQHTASNILQATRCSMLPAKTGDTTKHICVYIYVYTYRCVYILTSTYVHRYMYVSM